MFTAGGVYSVFSLSSVFNDRCRR